MLSFAGVDLSLGDPGGAVQAWIDRYRSMHDLFPVATPASAIDGRDRPQGHWAHAVGLPRFNWQQFPPRWRINSLWWPTGASRFAIGLFLTDLAGAQAIQSSVGQDGSGILKIDDGTESISVTMWALPMRPLGAVGTDNPVVLLPLVDRRYFWQWSKIPQLLIGPTSTWANVRSKIVEGLGASVLQPNPESAYLAPDWSEWLRWYENAALAMDGYASTVGQRFVATLSGAYQLQKWDVAEPLAASNLSEAKHTAGGALLIAPGAAPGKVSVAFPKRQGGLVHQNGACEIVTKNAADYQFVNSAPGEAVIHTTFQANFSARSSGADNASQLSALAGAIARDFYGWRRKQYSGTFPGVKSDWVPTGFDDYLWFLHGTQVADDCECDGGDSCSGRGQYLAHTLVESLPTNFGVDENLTQAPATGQPRTFRPSPVHRVQLTSDWSEPGGSEPAFATARVLYESSGAYPPTGEMSMDGHDVTIFDTLNLRAGTKANDKTWVAALPADSEMFELVTPRPSREIVVFELLADLNLKGFAPARICGLIGGVWTGSGGATINVIDGYAGGYGLWSAPATVTSGVGTKGIAIARGDNGSGGRPNYEIVYMERLDALLVFTVAVNRPAAVQYIEADYVRSFQHGDCSPFTDSQTPGRVWDPEFLFPRALEGGKGIARFNNDLDRYEVVMCQQMVTHARCLAAQDICAPGDVAIKDFFGTSFSPFNLEPDPLPGFAANAYALMCKENDVLDLKWDEELEKWVVIQVEHKKKPLAFDYRLQGNYLQVLATDCAVQYCEEPVWVDKIPLTDCSGQTASGQQ